MKPNRLSNVLAIAVCFLATDLVADSNLERVEGLTEPYLQIELAAGEPGVLASVDVQEGDRVETDQMLAQLDTSVLSATLKIAQLRAESFGTLKGAEAELTLRQKYLAPLLQLRDRGNATQREIDRAEADVEVAQARVQVAKEELALQQLECSRIEAQIRRRQIVSPINGVVSEVFRDVGETLMANDPRVVTIVQLDQLRAKFALLPDQANRVRAGQAINLELLDGQPIKRGMVETVSPVMDGKSATIEVTVVIPNEQELIPSGARCVLFIPASDATSPTRTNLISTQNK